MIKASVCFISFSLWFPSICSIIFLIGYGDGIAEGSTITALSSPPSESPTRSQSYGFFSQAVGAAPPPPPSTIFFNQTSPLACNVSENTPGYLTTIFMSNAPFAFGCLSKDTSSYLIGVFLSGANFPNTPIWLANRYRPVKDNASLSLNNQGSLILQDSDGTAVWSSASPISAKSGGLHLTLYGNLILFDKHDSPLWQSFSEPVDLLVPGQFLNPGSMLTAGSVTLHMTPTGNFTAVMNAGGLIFYENSTSKALPYYALKYPLISTTADDVLESPCNHTRLQLTRENLTQIQTIESPLCRTNTNLNDSAIFFDGPVVFIRLDPTGVLKGYYPDHKLSYDVFKNITSKGLCGFPNVCGPYGICEGSQQCVCPGNQSNQFFTQTGNMNFLLSKTACTPKEELTCQQGSTKNQQFLDVKKVDYFANDFISATMLTETLDHCKAACAGKCTCRAAFYRAKSKQCYLHESVMSMIRVSNEDYVGSIKLQLESADSKKSEFGLIIGISVASVVSICFFGMWYYYHKGKMTMHKPLSKDEDELLASLPGQPKRFTFKELQAATWEFSQKLGVGGFGSVYKGVFPDGSCVAVKQLENTTRNTQGMKEFRNEVIALSNINHQNLVHLRGFCADGGHRLLVYEYVSNGSLDAWLFRKGSESPGPPLNWKTRLSIAVHTARGLVFLHEQCRNRIVHLDIKPQNILLNEHFIPKLSDFGLSRLINEDQDSAVSRMRGTPGYMAPECLILTDATEKSDVYSFGMVLLEIVSGRKNVDVSRLVVHGDGEGWYFPALAARKFKGGHVLDIIDKNLGQLNSEDMAEVTRVIKIAFWCIQDEPSLRPTMGNALLMLEGYSQVAQPPLSFHFGMRFHLSNSIASNPHTPLHNTTNLKCMENGDHHQQHHADENEAKLLEQPEQELTERGELKDFVSPRQSYTSSLSSHHTSPRVSPCQRLSPAHSFPNSPSNQASPHHSPLSARLSSPSSFSHRASPRNVSPVLSPRRASPLGSSPLSQNPISSYGMSQLPSNKRSQHTSPLHSSGHSPASSEVSSLQHV